MINIFDNTMMKALPVEGFGNLFNLLIKGTTLEDDKFNITSARIQMKYKVCVLF